MNPDASQLIVALDTLLALFQSQDAFSGQPPGWFTYTAITWAVGVTTTTATLVLTGKLRLGREIDDTRTNAKEQVELYKALWDVERGKTGKLETALEQSNDQLRLQNTTLAATVQALQQVAKT